MLKNFNLYLVGPGEHKYIGRIEGAKTLPRKDDHIIYLREADQIQFNLEVQTVVHDYKDNVTHVLCKELN